MRFSSAGTDSVMFPAMAHLCARVTHLGHGAGREAAHLYHRLTVEGAMTMDRNENGLTTRTGRTRHDAVARTSRLAGTLAAVFGVLLVGCGDDGGDAASAPPQPGVSTATDVAGSFVGKVADTDALVAVVTDGRRVRAYVCDGPARRIAEYAEGTADRGHAELTSRRGARYSLDLTEGRARGTLTLTDGRRLTFDAAPATSVAGLYELTFTPQGSFGGGSASGASLAARVRDQHPVGANRVRYTVAGTVIAADGTAQPFARYIEGDGPRAAPIGLREIVAADGESRGLGKGDGLSWTDKEFDF